MYGGYLWLGWALVGHCLISPTSGSQSAWSLNDYVPVERREFRQLLANDPSYFDQHHASNWDPTMYEQLVSIGYNASLDLLEATIEIKLSNGFDGGLCTNGSTEYVGFYVDYGSGWSKIGIGTLNTHDIHRGRDCHKQRQKPLLYSIPIGFEPPQNSCSIPVLPKIRAILSWEVPPPSPFFIPVWGNVLDQHVQSPPRPLRNLSHEYPTSAKHRTLPTDTTTQSSRDRDFSPKSVELPSATLNAKSEDQLLRPPGPNVYYEELIALGLDYNFDRLVATVRIKQPVGYGSDLCQRGALEYVSFWADWNDTCDWTYLGTQTINVHDIPDIPRDGLTYSAILPVNLEWDRAFCNTTKVARIQAALSFDSLPPPPPALPFRGNFLMKHVQLKPYVPLSNTTSVLNSIGGVEVINIDWTASGQTKSGATFKDFPYAPTDPLSYGRSSPFGGLILVTGPLIGLPGQYSYRLLARRAGTSGDGVVVTNEIYYPCCPSTPVSPTSEGYFPYNFDPITNFDSASISYWTPPNGLWQIRLEIATTGSYTHAGYTPWYNVLVNNIYPTGNIYPTSGSTCGDFYVGTNITGNFWVDAQSLAFWTIFIPGGFEISYLENPPPSVISNVPGPPGSQWTMSTDKARPCGYTVYLYIEDLTVWDSKWYPPMYIEPSFSFCLLAAPGGV